MEAFLEHFYTCAKYNRWDEEDMFVQLKLCLKGNAAGLLKDCRQDVRTFAALEAKIKQRFDAKGREVSFRAQLRARRRGKGEMLQELYIAIGELVHSAYPGRSSEHRDVIACDAFLDALDDAALEQRVRDKMPDNLDEAYRLAVVMESNSRGSELRAADRLRGGNRYEARAAYGTGDSQGGNPESGEQGNATTKAVEKLILCVGELLAEWKKKPSEASNAPGGGMRRRSGNCYNCGATDHWAAQCPARETAVRVAHNVGAVSRSEGSFAGEQPGAGIDRGPRRSFPTRGEAGRRRGQPTVLPLQGGRPHRASLPEPTERRCTEVERAEGGSEHQRDEPGHRPRSGRLSETVVWKCQPGCAYSTRDVRDLSSHVEWWGNWN